MRHPLTNAVLAATLSLAAADETPSTVRFANNDTLTGSVESLTTERLVWRSPILEKPTAFFLKTVLDLTLTPEQPEITAAHEATVTLTNGDLIRGQLASVADGVVELDTWFAGRIRFNRLMIADIKIAERQDFLYRGPTGLDGWTQSGEKPNWNYQNGGFRSNSSGSIARDVALPDECSIAFDAAWRGNFSLRMAVFSDDLENERPGSGYDITFQSRSIYLRSSKTQKFLGHTPNAVALQENEKARIEIRASLKSGKICVFIDGRLIEVWTDPEVATAEVGRGIHFITQNASPVQISRIEVGHWDGEVDQLPDPQMAGGFRQFGMQEMDEESEPEPEKQPEIGRMELRNGDSINGEVLAIEEGMITVKTSFRDVKLPVESLRSVALKPVDLERCKRENGDVRGWFPDGSSIVFRLDQVNDGTLTGYSQNFGTARFKTAAFNRIEFNIYDPALEKIRNADSW
ncbi:MAG: hypothetical protein WED15_05010 [Akkermansiaceae bacterium]